MAQNRSARAQGRIRTLPRFSIARLRSAIGLGEAAIRNGALFTKNFFIEPREIAENLEKTREINNLRRVF